MSRGVLRRLPALLVGLAAAFVGVPARSADTLAFVDIAGWWAAEPTFGGESSPVLLHFVEDKGKPTVRLSMLAIGGFDVPVGTIKLAGRRIEPHLVVRAGRADHPGLDARGRRVGGGAAALGHAPDLDHRHAERQVPALSLIHI